MGLDWIDDHHFRKIDEKDVVVLADQDSFLSIIPNQKLPYCVEEKTLNRMIMPESDNKSEYKHVYCFYANIVHQKVIELGYYYHKSNLKHILRSIPKIRLWTAVRMKSEEVLTTFSGS